MAGAAKKKRKRARGSKKKAGTRDVVADLTDDVLVDILSRLPIKSLCRSKLVSKRWRNLISHPEHGKKLPHTLAGFFYKSYDRNRFPKSARHFTNVSRAADPFIDPSLSFLPLPEYKSIDIKDSCNGLLLCHCWKPTDPVTMDSVVCNPATEKWVVVPDSGWSSKVRVTHLGFDPAISSHFHVFEFIPDDFWYDDGIDGRTEVVAVYSSKTGVWSLNENEDLPSAIGTGLFAMPHNSKSVFFNGFLHLATFYGMVITIDVEGKVLRCIPFPIPVDYDPGDSDSWLDVYLSQGHLYLTTISDESDFDRRSVWLLEDYNSENWTLKYNIDPLHMFGVHSKFGDFLRVISMHPEHDTIFMVCGKKDTLMSYEMDRMRLRFISRLGQCWATDYIPYVPLFLQPLADDEQ